MFRTLFLLICLLATTILPAEAQKKKPVKEKAPTQKEMEEMMKELEKEMENMSEEDKKMMDSMGMKMPSLKNVPTLTDKQWADAMEEEGRIVPDRDATRIAAIPKPVATARMSAYIAGIHGKISSTLAPVKVSMGNKVYDYIRANSKDAGVAGNHAMGLWLAGQPELAVYVLGKLLSADATDVDNLSNYSAMLTMQGAQHLAIPILNNLNARYPKNSTLLNNLGQAWFGLGELSKAEKYLDSAIRIYAYHPQANVTKSAIEESRGNTKGAIEAAKRSIVKGYTPDKESRLKKLGYKLKSDDLHWGRPMPADPLGLDKFTWPAYPMTVSESMALEPEWRKFKERCSDAMKELSAQEAKIQQAMGDAISKRTKSLFAAAQTGGKIDAVPPMAAKAMIKLDYLVNDKDGHISFNYKKKVEAVANAMMDIVAFDKKLEHQLQVNAEKYEDQFGEGKPNPFGAACADDTKAKDAFLTSANTLLRDRTIDFLNFMKRKITNDVYFAQYTSWPENFELIKLQAKMTWLSLISGQNPKFQDRGIWCKEKSDEEVKPFKLANFEDMHCEFKSSINLGCLKMVTNCGQTLTTYGCGPLTITEKELGQNYTGATIKVAAKGSLGNGKVGPMTVEGFVEVKGMVELDANNDIKDVDGKVTVGIKESVGIQEGPVKAGASATQAIEIEVGNNGVEDVNLVLSGSVSAGIGAPKTTGDDAGAKQINQGVDLVNKGIGKLNTSVEVGIESRTSLISGHGSVSGKGLLSGITFTEW